MKKKTVTMVLEVDSELNAKLKAACKDQRLGFPRDIASRLLEDAIKKTLKRFE